jgi:Spy/CpxP family protein refolding chaperone
MSRAWAIVSVLALFVAGVSIGALGMHLCQERMSWRFHGRFGQPPQAFLRYLEKRLDLTEEQEKKIAEIRAESRRDSESLRRELRPRIEKQMEATHEKIFAVLTPEQRQEMEKLMRDEPWAFHHFFLGEGDHRPGGHSGFLPGGPHSPPPDAPPGAPPGPPPGDAPPPEPPRN